MPETPRIPIAPQIVEWIQLFTQHAWNGRMTIHFHEGRMAAIEPQPNVKLK